MREIVCQVCGIHFNGHGSFKYCEKCKAEAYNRKRRLYYNNKYKLVKKKRPKSKTLTIKQWEELSIKLDKMGISYGYAVAKGLV